MSIAEMQRIFETDGQRAMEAYIEHHTEVRYHGRDVLSMEDELDLRRDKISEIEIAIEETENPVLRGLLECYLEYKQEEADELEAELYDYYEAEDGEAERDYWREVI